MSELWAIITSTDPEIRNGSLDSFCRTASVRQLQSEVAELERLRHTSDNLYERVRALFFLYAIYRFYLPHAAEIHRASTLIPFVGYEKLLNRRYEEAIASFHAEQVAHGLSDGLSSALAAAYRGLAFQTLADQVRRSVRSVRGNQWMFRAGHSADYALRLRPELLERAIGGAFPILHETTPVRMDLSHSGWSDIFFLGMDLPELARVLNVSIDLAVLGSEGSQPKPPVEAFLRVIDRPVIRLVSIDLDAVSEITELQEMFDFGCDYLGLLKAAVIAAGLIPPGLESSGQPLADILHKLIGQPGLGIEIVTHVNNIPIGFATRRVDQPAGLSHLRLHARNRPGFFADRPVVRSGTPVGRGARHLGRVAGRLRRRMAGFRRRMARYQAHRGRTRLRRRCRIRRKPGAPFAGSSRPHPLRSER